MAAVLFLFLGLQALPLAEPHRYFLEDEAHFLLSADERTHFDTLASDEARDRFIEAFWQYRDRVDHADRLRSCERWFGPRGRWSERGRVYQLLGPPTYREDFARVGQLWPTELWHYTGVETSFLPDSFYLIFFRRDGAGDYRLWNPDTDGVGALVPTAEPSGFALGAEPRLDAIDPELTLAVDELVSGAGQRGAQSLLANLGAFVELAERDRVFGVDVRTAVATLELRSRLRSSVFADDAGVVELHYALDLPPGTSSELTWRSLGERYRARFTLVGRVVARVGGVALERERWEDTIELDVSANEKDALSTTWLSFRGRRLVQPSDQRFELALVSEGAGTVVAADIDHHVAAGESERRARAFASEGEGEQSKPLRALVRERTREEEARYRFARGHAFVRDGKSGLAIEELEIAAELDDDVRVHLELARLLYASRRYREVLAHFDATPNRFAKEVDVWVIMAGAAESLGQLEDAIAYYDRALALEPDNEAIARARAQVR